MSPPRDAILTCSASSLYEFLIYLVGDHVEIMPQGQSLRSSRRVLLSLGEACGIRGRVEDDGLCLSVMGIPGLRGKHESVTLVVFAMTGIAFIQET